MKELLFGTAGIPLSTPESGLLAGIKQVRKLGLEALELEFVRRINIHLENAPLVEKTAKKENVVLTCHAPYFINLNSVEQEKVIASKRRIINSARIANACGAFSLTFHAAFYQKAPPEKVYFKVKEKMKEMIGVLQEEGNSIWLRPETTGKPSQWGSLKEILQLSQELEQVMPCIDFAHLHARTNGKNNSLEEFRQILGQAENALGRKGLENLHLHLSGVHYGEKGEKHHLVLEESDFRYRELMQALKEFRAAGVLISESPNIEGDALRMKQIFKKY